MILDNLIFVCRRITTESHIIGYELDPVAQSGICGYLKDALIDAIARCFARYMMAAEAAPSVMNSGLAPCALLPRSCALHYSCAYAEVILIAKSHNTRVFNLTGRRII